MSICQAGLDNEKPLYSGFVEVVDYLSDEHGWSRSVPNLSGKLKRGSLRYGEARRWSWRTRWGMIVYSVA